MNDEIWMQHALTLARRAAAEGEVPVGAVLVKDDVVIAEGWNRPISSHDPSAHAEIVAIREAGRILKNYRLVDTTLYVTIEPCTMCVGAMIHARIKRLVFGAFEPKTGAVGSAFSLLNEGLHNHVIEVAGGVLEVRCREELQAFFRSRRQSKKSD